MASITSEKLAQAVTLVNEAGVDAWMTFDRETASGGDPVLPLILSGGLTWQSALIVTAAGDKIAVVGNFDAEPITASGDWDEVIPYVQDIRQCLIDTLNKIIPAEISEPRIAVNYSREDAKADGIKHGMFLQLQEYFANTRFALSLVSAEEITSTLRSCKTGVEIERVRAAVKITDLLFDEVGRFAVPGCSELEVYNFVQKRIDEQNLGYGWDRAGNPIVNSGPDSMIGHGHPSNEITIAPGHILHLDLGVIKDGYSSDIQRCWYFPEPGQTSLPPDVTSALAAVSGAITTASELLRPGVLGWQVDAAARKYIVDAGYPEYEHALGHQVGRLAHDGGATLGPRWERYGQLPMMPLRENQLFTLELGVMVAGRGYLGLEEIIAITASGFTWLSERQLDIPVMI